MSKLAKDHSTITKKVVGPSTAKAITNEIGGSIMSVNIININIFFVLLSWEIIPSISEIDSHLDFFCYWNYSNYPLASMTHF